MMTQIVAGHSLFLASNLPDRPSILIHEKARPERQKGSRKEARPALNATHGRTNVLERAGEKATNGKRGSHAMGEEVRIRKATRKDFDFILCLSVETIWDELIPHEREHTSRRRLVNIMAKNLRRLMASSGMLTLIAEAEAGERAGFVMVGKSASVFTDQQQAFIYDIAVAPAFRRRGVGRMLMERAEAYARDRRMEFVSLMVDTGNEAARNLYAQLGFEESKVLMRKLLGPAAPADVEKEAEP